MSIQLIVIHCAATPNGRPLAGERETAAMVIDRWHKQSGFRRSAQSAARFNPHLRHIGYHYVIDTTGFLTTGRAEWETGAHVAGHNTGSIGICLAGTDAFTPQQWEMLSHLVVKLSQQYPEARVCGHRDLSPDLNGDGRITPSEYTKICPGFNVADWLAGNGGELIGHVFKL